MSDEALSTATLLLQGAKRIAELEAERDEAWRVAAEQIRMERARAEAAEAELRKALEAAMEAAKQDTANQAKVTAARKALQELEAYIPGRGDTVRTIARRGLAALDRQEP